MPDPVKFRLLLVEDSKEWANLFINWQLKPAGAKMGYEYEVKVLTHMMLALNWMEEHMSEVDVVLLDLGLPDCTPEVMLDGILPKVTKIWPCPVIVVTGQPEGVYDQRAITSGADAFIHKIDNADKPHLAVQKIAAAYNRKHRNATKT